VARMPKYEQIRNRMLREKHAPKAAGFWKGLWAVLNAGFVLWLLSAAFLTLGVGYFTNHAQCMRDANQMIERRLMLGEELMGRNYAFSQRVEGATNVKAVPFLPDLTGSTTPELAKVPYLTVLNRFGLIDGRVVYDDLPDDFVAKAKSLWAQIEIERQKKMDENFKKTLEGQKRNQDPVAFFNFRKLLAEVQFEQMHFEHELSALAYTFQPNCTPSALVFFALGYQPRILEAVPSPLFGNESIKSILREHIKRITDLEIKLNDAVSSM
jgi:hypothetical protein